MRKGKTYVASWHDLLEEEIQGTYFMQEKSKGELERGTRRSGDWQILNM